MASSFNLVRIAPQQKTFQVDDLTLVNVFGYCSFVDFFRFSRVNKQWQKAASSFKQTVLFFQIHIHSLHDYKWKGRVSIYVQINKLVGRELMAELNKAVQGQRALAQQLGSRARVETNHDQWQLDQVNNKFDEMMGLKAEIAHEKKKLQALISQAKQAEKLQKKEELAKLKKEIQELIAPSLVDKESSNSSCSCCVIS